ncbi:MAG: hypothetical protein HYR55_05850 [Acidobacteria bacterium]|nr:hypothetical protein [Acidobacteriota bacterium]MBI3654888.1 hypothetical protein [Acidobacteriota bacterium]
MKRGQRIVACSLALTALGLPYAFPEQTSQGLGNKPALRRPESSGSVKTPDLKKSPDGAVVPTEPGKEVINHSSDYNAQFRRDPFRSLLTKKEIVVDSTGEGKRPSGVRGMLISELKLIGVAKGLSKERIAIVVGPDQKAHFMQVGDRVWDGSIQTIDDAAVLFVREFKRGTSVTRRQDIKMYLYPPIQQ